MIIGVVGAGVSGVTFAISRKKLHPNDEVVIFEHLNKVLKKVLATGNGKCNIANENDISDNYENPLVKSILKTYDIAIIKEFLNSLDIKVKSINGLLYPITESAVTVRNAFIKNMEKFGVKVHLNVSSIDYKIKNNGIEVVTNEGKYKFDKLVFATGGKSSPKLGSDGSILPLLKSHGYKFKEFKPALCPIYVKENTKRIDGVRVKSLVKVYSQDQLIFEESGEVLFKEKGLSGIVIFNASRVIANAPNNLIRIYIDLLPNVTNKELEVFLKDHNQDELLESYIHPTLARYISELKLSKKELVRYLKGMPFTFDKLYDFDNSQVSVGGIEFNSINEDLSSKSEKGVHFLGELLDYTAPCGGYNLMWAMATGLHLAKEMK